MHRTKYQRLKSYLEEEKYGSLMVLCKLRIGASYSEFISKSEFVQP